MFKSIASFVFCGGIVVGVPSVSLAMSSPTCSYKSKTQDLVDRMCNVKTQGSLDAQYQGQRTNIPAKMEVLWKDGVKTTILFDGLIDPQETGQAREFTHVGIALVDGKGHFFKRKVNSFRVVCFSFSRLAEDMSDKSIMICQ